MFPRIFRNFCGKNIFHARNFSNTSRQQAKIFVDIENKYAHSVLESYENYKLCQKFEVNKLNEDLNENLFLKTNLNPKINSDEIFNSFKNIANYCHKNGICISDDKFDDFVDLYVKSLPNLTKDQLTDSIRLLGILPETPVINTKNFVKLWTSLDQICKQKLDEWNLDFILYVCDCWYSIHLGKYSAFIWHATKRICRRLHKLTPQQLVHLMFICNITRKPLVTMFDFEVSFLNVIDKLNIDEIGVMSMGFFKSSTKIHTMKLLEKIFQRIINEVNTTNDIPLVSILKILRYSAKIEHADLFYELIEKLIPNIERLSVLSCLHVALLGCDLQICNDKCIELILNKFNKNFNQLRLKDMERISHVIGLLNITTKNGIEKELCSKILKELRNKTEEIIRFPKSFIACLHFLTLCEFYDLELINAALETQFIKHSYSGNIQDARQLFCLDSFARINLKATYNGNLLTDKHRKTMGKLLTHYIPEKNSKYKLSATDKILIEVKDTIDDILEISYINHILPHSQRSDIIIAYNKLLKKSIKLSENRPTNYSGEILYPERIIQSEEIENVQPIAVIIPGWNNYVRNTNRMTGIFKLKIEQLNILGYYVIIVPWNEWRELEAQSDRINYMKRKLSPVIL